MAKSRYADRFITGIPLLEEIRDDDIGRLRELQKENHRAGTLRDWFDLAKAEKAVKERYTGRYLFELLQNANDAVIDAMDESEGSALYSENHPVRFELTDKSLLVANQGKPFTAANVRALCRLHKTTKSASKQVGHKGIGFKSVLEITDAPEIYSGDFAFGFDGDQFTREVHKVMGPAWQAEGPLPILRAPYPRNIRSLPVEDRERIEQLLDDYATVIRLPLAERISMDDVVKRLESDLSSHLLLFLTATTQIEIRFPDGREEFYYRDIQDTEDVNAKSVIIYRATTDSGRQEDTEESRWLVLGPIRRELPNSPQEQEHLKSGLGEAWNEVHSLRFSLAFQLQRRSQQLDLNAKSQPFHVYYPTQEFSGLRFTIHGDFYVGDDRKTLSPNPLNTWLIEEICLYLATDGIEVLKSHFFGDTDLVQLLAPVSRPERDFSKSFMQRYLDVLSETPFVPTGSGHYKAPKELRFPPKYAPHTMFQQIFRASDLRGKEKWSFPISAIITLEEARQPSFLLDPVLNSGRLTANQVVAVLSENGMPDVDKSAPLLELLALWWDSIPPTQRSGFIDLLKQLPIFPTSSGWKGPNEGLVFQANLRPEEDDLSTPKGFDFSVIVRSIYPPRGSNSNLYRLFETLGAVSYSARDIISRAILPVLTDEKRFSKLIVEEPQAIYQAYELLREYYLQGGSTYDLQARLSRIPVPAICNKDDEWREWMPAAECYLGKSWPGGLELETLYWEFDDCYFLDDIPALESDGNVPVRESWADFFCWLGVMRLPKTMLLESKISYESSTPLGVTTLWHSYLDEYADQFYCATPGHYRSRSFDQAHTLHHFEDLVKRGDLHQLLILFRLLAQEWSTQYRDVAYTWMSCNRSRCPSSKVEDFFLYQLRHSSWLPVHLLDTQIVPLAPKQLWILGETEPQDVRSLVPTLPDSMRDPSFRSFLEDLGFVSSGTAQIEDFIRLLQLLPEQYPLLIDDNDKSLAQRLRAISTVFNWICEHIQTGLMARGESHPTCPEALEVLAYRGGKPEYVRIGSPDLTYVDNQLMAQRWSEHCAFVRFNDDWAALRTWLGIPRLSEVVHSSSKPVVTLQAESELVQRRFAQTLPYFLALIRQAQPSNFQRHVARLKRLRLNVVEEIVLEERLGTVLESEPLLFNERVRLQYSEEPNPRGGPPVRSGDIFATKEILHNPYLLGDPMAEYVDIARLGDAFVLLFGCESDTEKMRFLESKGIRVSDVQEVLAELETDEEDSPVPPSTKVVLDDLLKRALQGNGHGPDLAGHSGSHNGSPGNNDHDQASSLEQETTQNADSAEESDDRPDGTDPESNSSNSATNRVPEYPKLDFTKIGGVIPGYLNDAQPADLRTKGGDKAGRGTGNGRVPSEHTRRILGKRGEEWAYENEKARLKELGYEPKKLEAAGKLAWISKSKETSNHDIRSIDVINGREQTVYIEVKSSVGDDTRIYLSRSELDLAMSQHEHYWLYWVTHVEEDAPVGPFYFKNVAQLILDQTISIDVDTMKLRMPPQGDSVKA